MWSLIQVLGLCQKFFVSHFPIFVCFVVVVGFSFFPISTGVISKNSFEFDAITFALNNTSAFKSITLRTYNATEPANGLFKQGKNIIRSH